MAVKTRTILASVCFGLFAAAATARADPLFEAPFLSFDVGNSPASTIVADFNGDGFADLLVVGGTSLSFLSGRGDGTFAERLDIPVPFYPQSAVATDFNGDGRLDLAVADQRQALLWILPGNGDGTFGVPQAASLPAKSLGQVAADLDGDGHPDLVVRLSSGLVLLPGRGDDTFASAVMVTPPLSVQTLAAADLDGNGRAELIAANETVDSLLVYFNPGLAPGQPAWLPVASGPRNFTVIDCNADGHADLVINRATERTMTTRLGRGDGTFGPDIDAYTGWPVTLFLVADLDGDGKVELAAPNGNGSRCFVAVFPGTGPGSFDAPRNYYIGASPNASYNTLAAVDVSDDGRPDLVCGYSTASNPGTVSVLLAEPGGGFGRESSGWLGRGPGEVVVADFDRDGRLDVVASSRTDQTISFLRGNGDGTFHPRTEAPLGRGVGRLAVGDVNGDSIPDLVGSGASEVYVELGNGDGSFRHGGRQTWTASSYGMAVADLNRDGRLDCVVNNQSLVLIFHGNAQGQLESGSVLSFGDSGASVAAADLDLDGWPDIVATAYWGGRTSVWYSKGDGSYEARVDIATSGTYNQLSVGDVNADGYPDIVALVGTTQVQVLLNDQRGRLVPGTVTAAGAGAGDLQVVDLTGDGFPDLAMTNSTSSVGVLVGLGDGTFLPRTGYGTAPGLVTLGAGDFDGDGRTDLVAGSSGDFSSLGEGLLVTLPNVGGAPAPNLKSWVLGRVSGRGVLHWALTPAARAYGYRVFRQQGDGPRTQVGSGRLTGDIKYDVEDPDPGPRSADYWIEQTSPRGALSWYGPFFLAGLPTVTVFSAVWDGLGHADVGWTVAPEALGYGYRLHRRIEGDIRRPVGDRVLLGSRQYSVTDSSPSRGAADYWLAEDDGADVRWIGPAHLPPADATCSGVAADSLFEPEVQLAATADVVGEVSVDLNGDAWPDLVVLSNPPIYDPRRVSNSLVTVFLGDGRRAFRKLASQGLSYRIDHVELVDLTDDGILDLVYDNNYSGGLTMHAGKGDGTFGLVTPYSGITGSLLARDLDGDDRPDLVQASLSGLVVIRLARPGGGLGRRIDVSAGTLALLPLLADVNGDRRPDLVTVPTGGTTVSVRPGVGDGTFGAAVTVAAGGTVKSLQAADVDRDGLSDLVATLSSPAGVAALTSAFGKGPAAGKLIAALDGVAGVRIGDYDADGWGDIAATTTASANVRVCLNRCDGTFAPAIQVTSAGAGGGLVAADLDADGRPDLIRTSTLRLLFNRGPVPPVDALLGFSGSRQGDVVLLQWQVTPPGHVNRYRLLRQRLGGEREAIDSVFTGGLDYRYLDADAGATAVDYRLEETTPTGSVRLTGPARVDPRVSSLLTLDAWRVPDGVLVAWTVGPEASSARYRLYWGWKGAAVTDSLFIGRTSYRFLDRTEPVDSLQYWLEEESPEGYITWYGPAVVRPWLEFRLLPPSPNPASGPTTLVWWLSEPGHVQLRIFDARGRLRRTLVDADQPAGSQAEQWAGMDESGRRVPAGVYFIRLDAGGRKQTAKLVRLP